MSRATVGGIVVTSGPRTFVAQWQPVSTNTGPHQVIFNLNGGNVAGNTTNINRTVPHNTPIGNGNVPVPVRPGHTFQGWREAPSTTNMSGAQVGGLVVVSGPRTFVAQWQPVDDNNNTGNNNPPANNNPPPANNNSGNGSSSGDGNPSNSGQSGTSPDISSTIPPAWQSPLLNTQESDLLHHVVEPTPPEPVIPDPNGNGNGSPTNNPQTGDTFSYNGILIAIVGILVSSIALSIIKIKRGEEDRGARRHR